MINLKVLGTAIYCGLCFSLFSQSNVAVMDPDSSMEYDLYREEFKRMFDTIQLDLIDGDLFFKMRGGKFPFKRLLHIDKKPGFHSSPEEIYVGKEKIKLVEKVHTVDFNRQYKFIWSFQIKLSDAMANKRKVILGKMTLGLDNELVLFDIVKEEGNFFND